MRDPGMNEEGIRSWVAAVRLLAQFDRGAGHLDSLLDAAGREAGRWLVMAVFRHRLLIDAYLEGFWRKRPREAALNVMRLAMAERLEAEGEGPRIVHHAVEVGRMLGMSRAELGFMNAVLRRALTPFRLTVEALEESHPAWLVSRWRGEFGDEATQRLLRWNQSRPRLTLAARVAPAELEPTPWPGYFSLGKARLGAFQEALERGEVYVQDPFARLPVEALGPRAGETLLDLCAAPGGKTRLLAEALGDRGRLLAVDRPGPRMERLVENLRGWNFATVEAVAAPVEDMEHALRPRGVEPGTVDGILLDVPCSNTGVMQKRPDVKLRLSAEVITEVARQQALLLEQAAVWVRPGGRLVYSTCSIEHEENAAIVEAFCCRHQAWQVSSRVMSYPWECGHDGGGAFLLTRRAVA